MVVTRLARRLRQQGEASASPTQLAALATIERDGPLTLGALAAIERVRPPTITAAVGRLEERGLVRRRIDERTGVARVEITPRAGACSRRAAPRKTAYLERQQGPHPDERDIASSGRPRSSSAFWRRSGRDPPVAPRATFRSMSVRNYRLYFAGQLISTTGTWMQSIAQACSCSRSRGGVALGVTVALQFTPVLLVGAGRPRGRPRRQAPAARRRQAAAGGSPCSGRSPRLRRRPAVDDLRARSVSGP